MAFASVVVGSTHLPGWAQAVVVIVSALAFLMILRSRFELPEGAAQRLVIGCVAAVVALVIVSTVVHAAPSKPAPPAPKPDVIIIDCGEKVTWLDWVFWIC